MKAALGLVVGMIVFHKPRGIVGQRVDDTTGTLVSTYLIVLGALGGNGLALLHALRLGVLTGKIALYVHLRHVVHRGGNGCLDARIDGGSIDGHATKAADADDTDALSIDIVLH